jgi:hypothetical protein
VLIVEQELARALVSSVLPTPVGPRNMNEPIGRFGSCRPARASGARRSRPPAPLRPDRRHACHLVFHVQQLLALAFQHLVDRNAGPARHDMGDHDPASRFPRPSHHRGIVSALGFGLGQLLLKFGDRP